MTNKIQVMVLLTQLLLCVHIQTDVKFLVYNKLWHGGFCGQQNFLRTCKSDTAQTNQGIVQAE